MENPRPVNPGGPPRSPLDRLRERLHNLTEQNRELRDRVQELESLLRDVLREMAEMERKLRDLALKNEVARG